MPDNVFNFTLDIKSGERTPQMSTPYPPFEYNLVFGEEGDELDEEEMTAKGSLTFAAYNTTEEMIKSVFVNAVNIIQITDPNAVNVYKKQISQSILYTHRPTPEMKGLLRVGFLIPGFYTVPIKPHTLNAWCSGGGLMHSTVVAYVNSIEELYTQWPDAIEVIVYEEDTVVKTSGRFLIA
jgi:hypothetical protein